MKKALTLAALCVAALAAAAPVASADTGQLLPGKLPTVQVREGTSQVPYKVFVPCQRNKRQVGNWLHWNVCDYTITLTSGTAKVATPDLGGDLYTFQRQIESSTQNGTSRVLDVKIVDDRKRERTETAFVDLRTEVRECHAWAPNPAYPNCNFDTGQRAWWQGQIQIVDNDFLIARPDVQRIGSLVTRGG